MNETSFHKCDACGGSGFVKPRRRAGVPFSGTRYDQQPCPVCLGRGEHPNRMPVADAVADAETLRRYLRLLSGRNSECKPAIWFEVAVRYGQQTRRYIEDALVVPRPLYDRDGPSERLYLAIQRTTQGGARAAFRAVPGLRG